MNKSDFRKLHFHASCNWMHESCLGHKFLVKLLVKVPHVCQVGRRCMWCMQFDSWGFNRGDYKHEPSKQTQKGINPSTDKNSDLQYRSKVSLQSLTSRKTRLETRSSKILRIESQVKFRNSRVGSFDFRVEKTNEPVDWLSFREVNWIREVLLCDVEGKASHLSSSCFTKNESTLPLLSERSSFRIQNDWSSQLQTADYCVQMVIVLLW